MSLLGAATDELSELDLTGIRASLERLARGKPKDLQGLLTTIEKPGLLSDTRTTVRLHAVRLDGNGRPRTSDLVAALCDRILDYTIRRPRIREAQDLDATSGGTRHTGSLYREAARIFTTLKNTGELGELLVFTLMEALLGIPQILAKMSLKTDSQMHIHGSDGVYAKVDGSVFAIYWAEAKLHKERTDGVRECLADIAKMLVAEGASAHDRLNEITTLRSYVDLEDPAAEAVVKSLLDRNSPHSSQVEHRAVCLVGFDAAHYPKAADNISLEDLLKKFALETNVWKEHIGERLKVEKLRPFSIEFFCVPLPSVREFREVFLREMRIS